MRKSCDALQARADRVHRARPTAIKRLAPPRRTLPHRMSSQGGTMKTLRRVARVAYTFVMMNVAAITGLIAIVRRQDVWK